ncbi:MAG: tRNA (N6-isopentenyl adenosine(37)-C2)-methylthiotransferase MiaB [Bacteroidales bacterium]|nr:tRNA (N6-isopentenyl adenosine(37)-C2)-methylthiotransferase MiaB [Bacteroidales bacterium]
MKVYIETYGCQMNVNDSEVILSILGKSGWTHTEDMAAADLILANTCSVRDNAEQRIWGRVEQFRLAKKTNRNAKIGIVGCMAERLKEQLLASGKVDLVCGPDAYRRLPELVAQLQKGETAIDVELSRSETYDDILPHRLDKSGVSAFISIMRGCNNVCSYCVVPYTRGVERSREPQSIVREALDLRDKGYKEITLLGQNVDSYRYCLSSGELNFAGLLEMVAEAVPEMRIRFSTSNPHDLSDEVLEVMASHDNICKHIHLPVQSGSNAMLEKMRRKYTREWYLDRVAAIRRILPDCGLSTDVIAGFCGETLEDHLATVSLMDEVGFDSAFMFQYSERPGTLAARHYADDVAPEEKTRRLNEIIEHQVRSSARRYGAQIGKKFEVLIEGPSHKSPSDLCGRASNNMMCVFPDTHPGLERKGQFTTVQVVGSTSATLLCEETTRP